MQIINLRLHKRKFLQSKRSLRYFLTKTENNPPKNLDEISAQVDKEVWKDTDCLSCANCCKTMSPTYTFQDMKRISAHFNMKIKDFKAKWLYLDKKENDWMNVSRPCQFLDRKTNMCTIYDIRPADCAGFPHLVKKKMKFLMNSADVYLYKNPQWKWVQFDVISISLQKGKAPEFLLIEDVYP